MMHLLFPGVPNSHLLKKQSEQRPAQAAWKAKRRPRSDNQPDASMESYLASLVVEKRRMLVAKRVIDVAGASLALLISAPLLLMVAIAIRAESAGSPIFVQTRVGRYGQTFRALKFRSYYSDRSDPAGLSQPIAHDPKITPLGSLLRRTSIDELPQLWNVLKGEMSLVGPRPHVPGMLAADQSYEELVPAYNLRHLVKPGLTGLAQSRGYRGPTRNELPARMRIACDFAYIEKMSIRLDLNIMLWTVVRELKGVNPPPAAATSPSRRPPLPFYAEPTSHAVQPTVPAVDGPTTSEQSDAGVARTC